MPEDLTSATPPTIGGLPLSQSNVAANPQEPPKQEDEQDKFFDFQGSKQYLQLLVNNWMSEVEDTDVRRKERKLQIETEDLRQRGELDEDETIVPKRVIDTNIQRELPPYLNYIKNSRRITIFTCDDEPSLNCDMLEQEMTRVASYEAWEAPHYKCVDGSAAHGWDFVEVVFDEGKPGHFALEHIGHDRLFFPKTTQDIQKCPRIIRAFDVTLLQLQDYIKRFGFDANQVNLIRDADKNGQKEAETKRIFKLLFKKEGIVYVGWFSLEHGVTDWLSKPIQLYMGIDTPPSETQPDWTPAPVRYYPIFLLPYKLNEEAKIVDYKGRCFYDGPTQEAQTAMWSAYVNGMTRASQLYGSPAQEDGSGSSLKELEDLKLKGGRLLSKPVQFWNPPYPDASVLKTLQFADTQNASENNQVNFAAINREDSRKTAKEISASQEQQQLLNSVQLTLFSTYIRQIYSFAWLIVQSQALQNKINFLRIQIPKPNPINPQVGPVMDPQTGQPIMIWVNDTKTLSHIFTVRAAGDVDVIQSTEIAQKMQQDWPIISQTILKDSFLIDYIKLRYPEKADRYAQQLQGQGQMDQLKGLVGSLTTMLDGLAKDSPDVINKLPAQQRADMASVMQQGHQVAGSDPSQ